MAKKKKKRKKIFQMCAGKDVNYKDVDVIKKYIKPNGAITSTRMNGNCKLHQRHIANEIKKARFMALIPFVK